MSANKLLYSILATTKGMTKEELARAINKDVHFVRGAISLQRKSGKRIMDFVIPSSSGKNFYKKRYKVASNSEEWFEWRIKQLGDNVYVKKGSPRA